MIETRKFAREREFLTIKYGTNSEKKNTHIFETNDLSPVKENGIYNY